MGQTIFWIVFVSYLMTVHSDQLSTEKKTKNTLNTSWTVYLRTTVAVLSLTQEPDQSNFVNEMCSVIRDPDQPVNQKVWKRAVIVF